MVMRISGLNMQYWQQVVQNGLSVSRVHCTVGGGMQQFGNNMDHEADTATVTTKPQPHITCQMHTWYVTYCKWGKVGKRPRLAVLRS